MTHENQLIDPDPFVAASTFFAGASVVLNLIMVWQNFGPQSSTAGAEAQRARRLNAIEEELLHLRRALRQVTRSVDSDSLDSDGEFYDAQYRLHASRLQMGKREFSEYANAISVAFARCGTLSRWIHQIIADDPALASDLGRVLEQNLGQVIEDLNRAMKDGLPNRTVILEANRVLETLSNAVERKLNDGNH